MRSPGRPSALLAVEVGAHGVLAVLDVQLAGDDAPDLVLVGGVLRVRDGLAGHVRGGECGDGVAPRAVDRVGEAGVAAESWTTTSPSASWAIGAR